MKTVPREVADVNSSKSNNFASNPVPGKSPKFVDLRLSTAYIADKLKFVIGLTTRAGELTDNSGGLSSSHGIAEVTAERVSEEKAYSDYIKNYKFETMKVFEFENNYGTRLNQMTRPDQDIS